MTTKTTIRNKALNKAWQQVPIGEVAQPIARSESPSPGKTYRQVGVKWWGEGAYERQTIDGSQTQSKTLSRIEAGDIIINKIWARHGSVAIVSSDVAGCYGSNEFPTFLPIQDKLESRWFHWLTKTAGFWQQCDEKSRGTSGKNRIRPERFLEIKIPLPPLSEQRRIVAHIEELAAKIEEARGLRRETVEEAEVIVESRATELFGRLQQTDLAPIRTLGDKCSNPIQIGPFGAQLHSHEFVERGVPVLNVGNVWPTGLRLGKLNHVTPDKAAQLHRYSIQQDDLLFARSGATLGKVCIVPPDCNGWLMSGHLFRVRFDKKRCEPRFAFAALRGAKSIRDQVFGQVRGATRPGFNTTLLGNVELPLPALSEQESIVAYLEGLQEKVDSLKRLQAETATELDALLPSVLDKAFRGEL